MAMRSVAGQVLRLARSVLRLLVISLLLSVLPAWGQPLGAPTSAAPPVKDATGPEAQPWVPDVQPAAVRPWESQATDKTYSVQWDIDANGRADYYEGGYHVVSTRKIGIKGAATVHETSTGATALPMELKITDEGYLEDSTACVDVRDTSAIIDAGRYNGGPDPLWNHRGIFQTVQGPDGSWKMANPFARSSSFVYWRGQQRAYAYHSTDRNDYLCGGRQSTSHEATFDAQLYEGVLEPLGGMPLIGDPSGSVFSLNTTYDATVGGVLMTVKFRARVVVDNCKGVEGPVDMSDPRVHMVDLELEDEAMTPDGEATLRAVVTCEGVPVINAPVELTMKVKDRSGGHLHSSGNRPRGYIDTMEMGADSKFIGLTEEDGSVSFKIRPGRDLMDKSRGIAGLYLVDALVRWREMTSPTKRATFDAALRGLVPLPPSGDVYAVRPDAFKMHTGDFYGAPVAVAGVRAAAQDWLSEQVWHNRVLLSKGKSVWPIRPLTVYAMSVPAGGLFDNLAWASSAYMWRTPFQLHLTGWEVWLEPLIYEVTPEQRLWYAWAIGSVGERHGTWLTDSGNPMTLSITGEPAGAMAGTAPASNNSAGANPDVAASAVLVDPSERRVAGAGQTVAYAVGVENIISGTVASQVGLRAALPAGLSFISANPVPSRMEDAQTPAWDVGGLADEAVPRTFRITARVDPSANPGTLLVVTSRATTGSQDANPANNQFSDWGLTVQKPGPDLVVGSDLDAVALTAGDPVTFTIRMSNEGNAPAPASSLVLTVPAGINVTKTVPTAGAVPNGVRWDAGNIAAGSFVTVTASVRVAPGIIPQAPPPGEPESPLQFAMTAVSSSPDIDPASNQLQVDKRVEPPGPDLLVALHAIGTPGPGVLEVGKEVTYTLHYGNFGNRESSVVTGTLGIWPGPALVGSQPAPTTNELNTTSGVRTLAWNLGKLPIGGEGEIAVRLRVDDVPQTGSIVQANVSSKDSDLDPADNAAMETRYKASAPVPGAHKTYLPVIRRP